MIIGNSFLTLWSINVFWTATRGRRLGRREFNSGRPRPGGGHRLSRNPSNWDRVTEPFLKSRVLLSQFQWKISFGSIVSLFSSCGPDIQRGNCWV
jgi:hypothetical protein